MSTLNTMKYKKYTAVIDYSAEDDCFIGHIAGINDIVGFHGESVAELHAAFKEAVDDYLATCKAVGKAAQRPYSGNIMLRVPADLHARVALAAGTKQKSLNAWFIDLLSKVS